MPLCGLGDDVNYPAFRAAHDPDAKGLSPVLKYGSQTKPVPVADITGRWVRLRTTEDGKDTFERASGYYGCKPTEPKSHLQLRKSPIFRRGSFIKVETPFVDCGRKSGVEGSNFFDDAAGVAKGVAQSLLQSAAVKAVVTVVGGAVSGGALAPVVGAALEVASRALGVNVAEVVSEVTAPPLAPTPGTAQPLPGSSQMGPVSMLTQPASGENAAVIGGASEQLTDAAVEVVKQAIEVAPYAAPEETQRILEQAAVASVYIDPTDSLYFKAFREAVILAEPNEERRLELRVAIERARAERNQRGGMALFVAREVWKAAHEVAAAIVSPESSVELIAGQFGLSFADLTLEILRQRDMSKARFQELWAEQAPVGDLAVLYAEIEALEAAIASINAYRASIGQPQVGLPAPKGVLLVGGALLLLLLLLMR